MDLENKINQNNNNYSNKHILGWMNWKHKDKRYLPVGLKQSETSDGSTNFRFAESWKRMTKYVSKSYTKRLLQWVGTWIPDLKLQLPMRKLKLILHTNQLEGFSTSWDAKLISTHFVLSAKTWFSISLIGVMESAKRNWK